MDHLCPALPNRLNYIHWIEDVLHASHITDVQGLDIGTGSIAIYACLACAMHPAWTMVGTDIDPSAVASARATIESSPSLAQRITLVETTPHAPLFPRGKFAFCMCNPPFYASPADRQASASAKQEVRRKCTGHATELYTPGGELRFVQRMMDESMQESNRARIVWFSSMLGKLSSLHAAVAHLRCAKITNYAVTEFMQGTTKRWAIAWSFHGARLPDTLVRSEALAKLAPRSTERTTLISANGIAAALRECATLPKEHVDVTVLGEEHVALGLYSACWTRGARRKRKRKEVLAQRADPVLQVELRAQHGKLTIRWLYGMDAVLFESLSKHLFDYLANYSRE
ncbi:23S rRNA (adenine(1618)-N(6))-methyltransferase [Malassezia vespertilionis]|uniref:23S rRNA (adenine(1618)-N(6))-methyltransferase n=1 Tax=Malassezia vespertilionis TaxID=2020962 RepID=UPI0024B1CAA6|nr:23S rRNA (adenine(1618)-N(6))-methyltransferase [Malassezia vespertilionis]WFD04810.1 23S rRNA (adenine(1618)-N(6))-methyltransferase [Malassezia vespertilionis]